MNQHRLAIGAIAAAAVMWGTTGTAAAFAPSVNVLAIGAGAMGIGGLLQSIVNASPVYRHRKVLRASWTTMTFGALCVAIYPLAFYTSMRVAGVALGCVVSLASAPLASAVLERIFDGRTLTRRWMLACCIGVSGAALLSLPHGGADTTTSNGEESTVAGIVLGLIAGVTYAGYSRSLRRLMAVGVSRKSATGAVFGLGGMALIPLMIIAGGSTLFSSWSSLIVIGYLAVIPMFVGYVLFSYGLGHVDATTATTTTLIEPAVATATAVVILNEAVTALGWLGMALLAVALGVLIGGTHKETAPSRLPQGTRWQMWTMGPALRETCQSGPASALAALERQPTRPQQVRCGKRAAQPRNHFRAYDDLGVHRGGEDTIENLDDEGERDEHRAKSHHRPGAVGCPRWNELGQEC